MISDLINIDMLNRIIGPAPTWFGVLMLAAALIMGAISAFATKGTCTILYLRIWKKSKDNLLFPGIMLTLLSLITWIVTALMLVCGILIMWGN